MLFHVSKTIYCIYLNTHCAKLEVNAIPFHTSCLHFQLCIVCHTIVIIIKTKQDLFSLLTSYIITHSYCQNV